AYVHQISREVDLHPNLVHSYATTRHVSSRRDEGDDEGGIPLAGLAGDVATKIAKSEVGDLMQQYGLGSLADTLGITDPTQSKLDAIATQLDGLGQSLTTVQQDIDSLETGVGSIEASVSQTNYNTLVRDMEGAVTNLASLGGAQDTVLTNLNYVADT